MIRGDVGVMAELRNVVRKKHGGRGASSRKFVRKIGVSDFFFVDDATQVFHVMMRGTRRVTVERILLGSSSICLECT